MNWEELKAESVGAILHDEFKGGFRFIIMRGPASLCAYIGIPSEHPLANQSYDDLPVDCHGGLTFSSEGKELWPKGFFWYGWDYAHSGDHCFYDDERIYKSVSEGKKWLVKDVEEDSWSAICDFEGLMRLAENIIKNEKAKQGTIQNI